MTPEQFEPQKLGRYTVYRAEYEYAGQDPDSKLFIVLRHEIREDQTFCWCIKATSQVQQFDEEMLKACVSYKAGEVGFFKKPTVIDPSNFITMLHSTLAKAAKAGKYKIEGKMPDDFHEKIVAAIRKSTLLEPKRKVALLGAIGEEFKLPDPTTHS